MIAPSASHPGASAFAFYDFGGLRYLRRPAERPGLTLHFTHATGKEARSTHFLLYLYACLLAQAGNFGLAQMAENADIPYHQLLWCNTWYIRENTLRAAFGAMVNYHHGLPLSQTWGGGLLSSSDGRAFRSPARCASPPPCRAISAMARG